MNSDNLKIFFQKRHPSAGSYVNNSLTIAMKIEFDTSVSYRVNYLMNSPSLKLFPIVLNFFFKKYLFQKCALKLHFF